MATDAGRQGGDVWLWKAAARNSVMTRRIELVLATAASYDRSYIVLRRNAAKANNKDTFLWNFAPNCGLGTCGHGRSMVLSTKLVNCGLHLDGRARRGWTHKVYYTLVDCNPLTPLLRFVLDLSYQLFLHCCAAVGKTLTDTARRAVPLR